MKPQARLFVMMLLGVALLVGLLAVPTAAAVINGVPDWHQPCLIVGPNGPGPGPGIVPAAGAANYRAWCAASTAADIMGYWRDVKGMTGVADGLVYFGGAKIAWTPPTPTDWQDDSADASVIPVKGPPASRTAARSDLGWYLNTNDQGDGTLPGSGSPGAETFAGTKQAALAPGLTNYLTAAGYGASTVTYQAFGGNWLGDWATIQTEINAGRPMMGLFSHGNVSPQNPNNPYGLWEWGEPVDDVQTGGDWSANGTGHAMTVVGYLNPGDPGNPIGNNTNLIIVEDNRKHMILGNLENDNVFRQITLPFCGAGGGGLAPWTGYVTVDIVPEPGTWAMLVCGALASLICVGWRRRGGRG